MGMGVRVEEGKGRDEELRKVCMGVRTIPPPERKGFLPSFLPSVEMVEGPVPMDLLAIQLWTITLRVSKPPGHNIRKRLDFHTQLIETTWPNYRKAVIMKSK